MKFSRQTAQPPEFGLNLYNRLVEPPEEYDFEKLAREIVLSRLKGSDKGPEGAAEILKQLIVGGVMGTRLRQAPRLTVSAVCRGIMSGMLLIEKDLPRTAVKILGELPVISNEIPIDPADLMTWAMEGIAAVAHMAGPAAQSSIQELIEEKFMGAGPVFGELCHKASRAL